MPDIIGRVKNRRLELCLSISEASKKAGVHKTTWLRWEKGDLDITLEYLYPIAKALSCSPIFVLKGA